MAKLGEGDSRWIVEERADGKNVGGWHWQEKDVFSWAQKRLQELLGGVDVVAASSPSSSTSFKTGGGVKTTGEAIVNSRKGKLIPAYEMTIAGTWSKIDAEDADGDEGKGGETQRQQKQQVTGDWEVYLADENADEDPMVRATVAPGLGAAAEDAARAFAAAARQVGEKGLVSKLREFVEELAAGGGGGGGGGGGEGASGGASAAAANGGGGGGEEEKEEEGKAKTTTVAAEAAAAAPAKKPAPSAAAAKAAKAAAAATTAAAAPPPKKTPSSTEKASTTTLRLTEKFYCRPRDLVEALTDARRVAAFTGAPAVIEGPPFLPGNKYSIFGGAVEATFAEGTDVGGEGGGEGKGKKVRIELDWRFREWPEGALSRVVVELREPSEGLTEATLVQTGIPTTDRFGNAGTAEVAESGWREKVFGRIRQVFGYGVGL